MKKKNTPPLCIAAIGDLHLTSNLSHTPVGSKYRTDQFIEFLEHAFTVMLHKKVDLILDAGDMCNEVMVGPETMELITCYLELSRISGIPNVTIAGNHDFDGDKCFLNFLNRLEANPKIFHFDPETVIWEFEDKMTRVVAIPFCSDNQFLNQAYKGKIPERERKDFYNILLAHIGIKGAGYGDTISKFGVDLEKIEELSEGYDLMVFGHYHKFQIIGPNGLYTGALQHLRIDQRNIVPGFPIIKLPDFKIQHIVNTFSPRFIYLEDYEEPTNEITNNIVKPIIDVVRKSEKENRKYLKRVLSFNPYHMIRPNMTKTFEAEGPIKTRSTSSKEAVINEVMKKIPVSKKRKKEYEQHVIELFREVSNDSI